MAIHKPYDRTLVSTGAVKTEGGSINLALGQLGVFKVNTKHNSQGMEALSNFKNLPLKEKVEIKVGNNTETPSSTFPFEIGKIKGLRASAPQKTEQTVDEVIIGFNGIDEKTSFTFGVGERKEIHFRLSGEKVGLLGYPQGFVDLVMPLDAKRCSYYPKDNCNGACNECATVNPLPILLAGYQTFLNTPLKGGVSVSELIDITVIKKCTGGATPTTTNFDFYELNIVDNGSPEALAAVQSQYPNLKIVREGRKGNVTTYRFVQIASAAAPAKFKRGVESFIKGCKDCPSTPWSAVQGGHLYTLTIANGAAETSIKAIDATPDVGVVQTSVVSGGSTKEGLYTYSFVSYKELTQAKIDAFLALPANKDKSVALTYVGQVSSVCKNDTKEEFAWTKAKTCTAIKQEYILDLPDTKCGANRLEELKVQYPTVALEGTTGGCQTRYKLEVMSNLVCPDDCADPIFAGLYSTEAPTPYDGRSWVLKNELNLGTDCKVGLRIKGKTYAIHPSENMKNELAFTESSVAVQVSGGYPDDLPEMAFDSRQEPFHVEYISRQAPRTHVGGNLWQFENMSRTFFTGQEGHEENITKMLLGEASLMPAGAQFVDYAIEVEREVYSQSFAQKYSSNVEYHILVQVGKHREIEKLLNLLVSANGIEPVRALAQ